MAGLGQASKRCLSSAWAEEGERDTDAGRPRFTGRPSFAQHVSLKRGAANFCGELMGERVKADCVVVALRKSSVEDAGRMR